MKKLLLITAYIFSCYAAEPIIQEFTSKNLKEITVLIQDIHDLECITVQGKYFKDDEVAIFINVLRNKAQLNSILIPELEASTKQLRLFHNLWNSNLSIREMNLGENIKLCR